MKEVLRQEKKYLYTYEQFKRMDCRFGKLLQPDVHSGADGYTVRSLYFDTMQERDFY